MAHASNTHRYEESGLPSVVLIGVEVRRCRRCGEEEVAIPNIEGLHRCIAEHIVRRASMLTAEEARFLRRFLGYSSQDFAALIGVRPETVSRWENAKAPVPPPVDRAIRLLVARVQPIEHYDLDSLKKIRPAPTRPRRIAIARHKDVWQLKRAA
jgi:putative zinc finger/helix-turn-helix YgiT family protein